MANYDEYMIVRNDGNVVEFICNSGADKAQMIANRITGHESYISPNAAIFFNEYDTGKYLFWSKEESKTYPADSMIGELPPVSAADDGKFLKARNGVWGAEENRFVITLTQGSDMFFTPDKTAAEVLAAYNAGKDIYVQGVFNYGSATNFSGPVMVSVDQGAIVGAVTANIPYTPSGQNGVCMILSFVYQIGQNKWRLDLRYLPNLDDMDGTDAPIPVTMHTFDNVTQFAVPAYSSTGYATNGTMTQAAITTAILDAPMNEDFRYIFNTAGNFEADEESSTLFRNLLGYLLNSANQPAGMFVPDLVIKPFADFIQGCTYWAGLGGQFRLYGGGGGIIVYGENSIVFNDNDLPVSGSGSAVVELSDNAMSSTGSDNYTVRVYVTIDMSKSDDQKCYIGEVQSSPIAWNSVPFPPLD